MYTILLILHLSHCVCVCYKTNVGLDEGIILLPLLRCIRLFYKDYLIAVVKVISTALAVKATLQQNNQVYRN